MKIALGWCCLGLASHPAPLVPLTVVATTVLYLTEEAPPPMIACRAVPRTQMQ